MTKEEIINITDEVIGYLKKENYILHFVSQNWKNEVGSSKNYYPDISFLPENFKQEEQYDPRLLPKTRDGQHRGVIFRVYGQNGKLYFQAYMANDEVTYSYIPDGYLYKGLRRKYNFIPLEMDEVKNFVQQLKQLF